MRYTAAELRGLIRAGRVSEFYNSWEWRRLSKEVIAAGHNECAECSKAGRYSPAVLVHHVRHLKDAPELAYDRGNLIPLCFDCHERIHGRGIYAERKGYRNEEKW